jgi:hypothetical protein
MDWEDHFATRVLNLRELRTYDKLRLKKIGGPNKRPTFLAVRNF